MQLKSSTLIESIIAMILIMLVLGLSMQVFLSKGGIGTNHNRFKACVLGNNIYNKTIAGLPLTDDDMQTASLTADKTVVPYKEAPGLMVLTIHVFDKDSTLLFTKKELIKSYVSHK